VKEIYSLEEEKRNLICPVNCPDEDTVMELWLFPWEFKI